MIKKKIRQPVLAGVLSILLLYIVLILMILLFAGKILSDISSGVSLVKLRYLAFSLVLPLFLITSIIINIYRLIKQRKNKAPGATFKTKLLIFFTFISLLSSIPQGILALSFINSAMESWFSSGFGEAMHGGLQIAIDYNRLVSREIKSFSGSHIFENILDQMFTSPDRMWLTVKSIHPMIDALEIFDDNGNTILILGDDRITGTVLNPSIGEGTISRSKQGDRSILKIRRNFSKDGIRYSAVISTVLPDNFDTNASNITRTIQLFSQFQNLHSAFFLVLIFFFTYFSLPILLLSILASFLLSDEIIKPVVHLEEAISRVMEGDYSHRILSKQKDDLANLVNSFNRMVAELEQSRQNLVQNEKVSAWQEIAQRMAHEIKNPLTPIKLSAQRILKKYSKEPESLDKVLAPSIAAIIAEVENLTKLIQQFRDFAKMPVPHPVKMNIKNHIEQLVTLYSGSFSEIDMDISGVKDISLNADPDQLKSIFSNLISNAVESLKGRKGKISIRADEIVKGNSRYCRIQIQDTGTGMDRDMKDKIFNPYFTTKDGGTGLGLPIVERMIAEHKGQIWFESEKGVGTTFFIDLPIELRAGVFV